MGFDFKNVNFRALLKDKEKDIHKRTSTGILECDKFKRLLLSLKTFHKKSAFVGVLAILISEEEIKNMDDNISDLVDIQMKSIEVAVNNHIVVDRDFKIIESERKKFVDNNEARRYYTEISKNACVFHLSIIGVHWFVDRNDFGESIFFTIEEQNRFNELRGIDRIEEIIGEYRIHLRARDTYSKFFVQNSGKRVLYKVLHDDDSTDLTETQFLAEFKQLLNNKPEDRFREDLKKFLENKLKGSFLGEEYVLENFRRLDIFISDDFGELYLIEVKWVGQSIHKNGDRLGTSFKHEDINPAGIIQSIDYIQELYETNHKIKLGFLAVFDARNGTHVSDTYDGFDSSTIDGNKQSYYAKFIKIPDFKVKNIHPQ